MLAHFQTSRELEALGDDSSLAICCFLSTKEAEQVAANELDRGRSASNRLDTFCRTG